ncbi:MAG: ABC transporter permease [Acidobacteriaceae bacterium]|nr:ABC transporter permease [Acidobacteriaceae bacterium]
MLRKLLSRIHATFQSDRLDAESGAEIETHLALLEERFERQGMSREDAHRAAERQLGKFTRVKENLREQRSLPLLETIWQDVSYALRQLRASPAFSITAILTLALGIGANTAIFSVVKAVLLNPLPYHEPERLVMVWERNLHRGWPHNIVSAANFRDWREHNHVFAAMAIFQTRAFSLSDGTGDPAEVNAEQVSPNLFSVLGVKPFIGRDFLPEEGKPGSARVAIVGNALWRGRYGSDPRLVGRQISLDEQSYTVIGIMPATFADAYVAHGLLNAQLWTSGLDLSNQDRTDHGFIVMARLKPGVSIQQAQTEMDVVSTRIQREDPNDFGWTTLVLGMHDDIVVETRPALIILLTAVTLVLLIACVNLANLLLARGARRVREAALRTALGASRCRLVRQLLTESSLLSVLGAGLGLLLAGAAAKALATFAPADAVGLANAGLNPTVLEYTLGLAVLTTLLFGLLPALGLSRPDLNKALKEGGRNTSESPGAQTFRSVLVSAEFALSLALLIGAVLMVRTIASLREINPGFNPDRLLTMEIFLDSPRYAPAGSHVHFFKQLLDRIQSLPGVQYASVSRGIPLEGWSGNGFVTAENPRPAFSEMPDANAVMVGARYFRTMGIPLLAGRGFTDADRESTLPVAIVNQELARESWPGQNPLGKRLKMYGNFPWLTVIGVSGNVRTQGLNVGFFPEIYMPYEQYSSWGQRPFNLVIRTSGKPLSVLPAVRRAVAELEAHLPISNVRTMDQVTNETMSLKDFLTMLLASFAGLALVLAAIGIYGVMAYSVAQRTQEIGVRMALGAKPKDVIGSVIRRGVGLACAGSIVGLTAALALTRFLSAQLYGVTPTDAFTFAVAPLIVMVVAVLATYIPAHRAAQIDPIIALRCE